MAASWRGPILRASDLGENGFAQITEMKHHKSDKQIVTSVFTYIYTASKWPTNCSCSIKTIPYQSASAMEVEH
jgi:hypothetical protein